MYSIIINNTLKIIIFYRKLFFNIIYQIHTWGGTTSLLYTIPRYFIIKQLYDNILYTIPRYFIIKQLYNNIFTLVAIF